MYILIDLPEQDEGRKLIVTLPEDSEDIKNRKTDLDLRKNDSSGFNTVRSLPQSQKDKKVIKNQVLFVIF
jgi:hypothetical protein